MYLRSGFDRRFSETDMIMFKLDMNTIHLPQEDGNGFDEVLHGMSLTLLPPLQAQ